MANIDDYEELGYSKNDIASVKNTVVDKTFTTELTTKGGQKISAPPVQLPTGTTYTLPPASQTKLGGVKVGSGLSVTPDGTLSTSGGGGGKQWYCHTLNANDFFLYFLSTKSSAFSMSEYFYSNWDVANQSLPLFYLGGCSPDIDGISDGHYDVIGWSLRRNNVVIHYFDKSGVLQKSSYIQPSAFSVSVIKTIY